MRPINEWYYFTDGLNEITCSKIRKSVKDKWEKSIVNTKKDITDEERITGGK